jgi:branched-chain amino acid transport system permease protein
MVSTEQSFLLVTMLVIGGEGTLVGPVIGVILLTLLPTMFQFLDNYKTMVSGVLLVVALLYFPSGLYGGFTSLVRRFSGGRSARTALSPTANVES